MNCPNVSVTYKEYIDKYTAQGVSADTLNKKWIDKLIEKRPQTARELKTITEWVGSNELAVQYNGGRPRAARLVDLRKIDGEYVVWLDNKVYSFVPGSTRSKDTYKGNFVIIPAMELLRDDQLELGSKKNQRRIEWEDYDRVETNAHKSVEGMQKLLHELHVLDGGKESEEHMDYLGNLLGKFDQKFLNRMKTYIKEGSETEGIHRGNNVGITVSNKVREAGNEQTAAEVYVHEMVHAITKFALEDNGIESRRLRRELEYVMEVARKEMTWKDFLPKESIDAAKEEKLAKDMYEYLFFDENAEHEFIAHVLTNPKVMEKAKYIKVKAEKEDTALLPRILDMFATLMDVIVGNYQWKDNKKNVHEHTMDLAFKLAAINKKAVIEAKEKESVAQKLMGMLNDADTGLSMRLQAMYDKHLKNDDRYEPIPPNSTKFQKAVWTAGVLKRMVTNEEYQKASQIVLSAWGIKPEGTIQSIMRDFGSGDDLSNFIDMVALGSDKIDQQRTTLIQAVKKNIMDGFKKETTEEENKAITRVVLETDLEVLYKAYGTDANKKIRDVLENEEELNRRLSRAKHALKMADETNYFWHVNQASGLGFYMARHKANIAQNLNSTNIAEGIMSSHRRQAKKEVVALIDEVATLTALKYTDKYQKKIVADLYKNEMVGMRNIMKIHARFKEDAKKDVFEGNERFMIKGYTREVFSDDVTMEIAPLSKKQEMEDNGFKLVKTLKNADGLDGKVMGIYTSEAFGTQEWYRAATRLTRLGTKGTSVKNLRYKNESSLAAEKAKLDKTKLDLKRLKVVDRMEKGEVDLSDVDENLAPVLTPDGNDVVDYRYMMEKDAKEEFLKQDVNVVEVLSRSIGHTLDKAETAIQNQKVLEIIMKDMKENYVDGSTLGRNNKEYIMIGPDSTDPKIQDLYHVLPKEFKEVIHKREDKLIAVRRDMMHNYFGFRHISILDFPGLKKVTPQMIQGLITEAESLWIEFMKIYKVDILIKMPGVIVGNIISNFFYSVMTGTSPGELFNMYKESTRDVRHFLKKHRELIELEVAKKSGNITKKDIARIEILKRELERNPVKELVDIGVYQAIVEDISKADLQSTNKLKKMFKEKTKNVPSGVKQAGQWLFLTEETGYYKFMTEVLQASDLIARDIENRKLKKIEMEQVSGKAPLPRWVLENKELVEELIPADVEKLRNGEKVIRPLTRKARHIFLAEAQQKRHLMILNNFVNYNKPSSNLEEYLNRTGAVMFTKYAKRIQRVIGETGVRYPIKSLLLLMGQNFILDVETIQDQSILNRSWYNLGISSNDSIPFTSPFERMMDMMNIPLVRLATNGLDGI